MILVQWPFACDPSLIPWWVGPSHKGQAKSWVVYWQPLLESIQEKVNSSVDAPTWLAGTGVESVLVAIVTPFFSEYEGKVEVLDGAAMVEVVVPEEIVKSRDLVEVAGHIEVKSFEALGKVAKKLRIDPPVRLIDSDRAVGGAAVEPDRISLVGEECLGDGVLALVPPRMAERDFAHAIARVAEEVGEHLLHGWRMFRDGTSGSAVVSGPELFVELDFREIDIPARLTVLEYSKANVLVVIGRVAGQIDYWLTGIDRLVQGAVLNPVLAGRDGEFEWVVFGFADKRSRGA